MAVERSVSSSHLSSLILKGLEIWKGKDSEINLVWCGVVWWGGRNKKVKEKGRGNTRTQHSNNYFIPSCFQMLLVLINK